MTGCARISDCLPAAGAAMEGRWGRIATAAISTQLLQVKFNDKERKEGNLSLRSLPSLRLLQRPFSGFNAGAIQRAASNHYNIY